MDKKKVTIVPQWNLRIRSMILALHPKPIGKESKHWTGVFSSHLWNQCHQVSLGTSWCQARMEPFSGGLQFCPRDPFCEEKITLYTRVYVYMCIYICGVFHKWGYSQMDGFCWNKSYWNGWFMGNRSLGNISIYIYVWTCTLYVYMSICLHVYMSMCVMSTLD